MLQNETLTLNGKQVEIQNDKNLLELIRRCNIDLPTFCYHSELSTYGACRLCIVEIEGMGIVTSCTTVPAAGMEIRTHSEPLRRMRRIYLELLLANHHQNCTTCSKSGMCRLQDLSARMGIDEVRFKTIESNREIDTSSPALIRDPNKCILCGDCVRACEEIQGVGAIDFVGRGSDTTVCPAFGKDLRDVDCVYCGLCASVCPTGAITPRPDRDRVWAALDDPKKKVVAQIAPAVRVALGEMFGLAPGKSVTGKIVAALRTMGFDKVFDTSFAADLTVLEEAHEFLERKASGERLPQFTSCCPAWVKYAEQYLPDFLDHLSSCRSPQQMFSSLAKKMLPEMMGIEPDELYMVSIMPCTAKKFEAQRPEFIQDGVADVDAVLTTQELARMIKQAGIRFGSLTPDSLDLPMGFKTGAGVIFGTTGGVTEAVLRFATEKLTGVKKDMPEFHEVRGFDNVRMLEVKAGELELKLAVVHGLRNVGELAEKIRRGELDFDLVEVMACPGGCIAGAGQPINLEANARILRAEGLYETDKTLQLHTSQDNPYLQKCYEQVLGQVGGAKAHHMLHTKYHNRRRFVDESFAVSEGGAPEKLQVCVCVGTSCYVRGSQKLLEQVMDHVKSEGLDGVVDVRATFCFEACDDGPTVRVGQKVFHKTNPDEIRNEIHKEAAALK